MKVSQKCQYAIRAVFELAGHYGRGPVKVSDIAKAQAIPPRFLEVILNQLKQGNFVDSKRGSDGGYFLTRPPRGLSIGEVIYFIEGPVVPVDCGVSNNGIICSLYGNCVFLPMWERVGKAIVDIYNSIDFQDLLDDTHTPHVLNYSI